MKKLLNIGLNGGLKDYQIVLVKNANASALILACLAFFTTAVFYFGNAEYLGFGLMFFIPAALTFILNAIHNTTLARVVFVVLTTLLLVVFHSYFLAPGQHPINYLFVTQFLVFLLLAILFDIREKAPAMVSLGLILLIYLCFPFLNAVLNATDEVGFIRDDAATVVFSGLNLLLALIMMFHLRYKKYLSDLELKEAETHLQTKTAEVEQQERELQGTLDEISKTHKEDDRRSWVSDGINQLNVILRDSDDELLFNKVLSHIVKYLKINQGGIYEIKENDFGEKFFAIRAVYGFEWNRVLAKEVSVNEEGILGISYREAAPVYRVEVPDTYSIESGLGKTKPSSIFVAPMIYEDNIEGMLELSAFRKFEDHEKEYVLKTANILARFIESYQVNMQSKELLEKTNQQTEEMRAQEEEMRQNMEELQATQEELHRKEREYISRIQELERRVKN